ncbi:MAG TPA: hypothetical protein VFL91_02740 [Thermomicrobiales bacterium]|nr:hypothetical protein [Thermomicrobiales bacterium]
MLPLTGAPQLVVVGREVQLGNGYADLIAVEPSGRLAIIEVKLARNAEARRAVVAQVLTYAAYLRGMELAALEQGILGRHLGERGYTDLADAVASNDQAGAFEPAAFAEGVAESLGRGRFRLVIVLDEAPEELVRLVGYLSAVADQLLIDLITVSAYEVNGSQILVPQRVDAEEARPAPPGSMPKVPAPAGGYSEGAEVFRAAIDKAPEPARQMLHCLLDWALSLEAEGLVRLGTYRGTTQRWTLLPRLRADNAGLVTIWNDNGAYLSFYRSVFERRAPASLPRVEELVAPSRIGQGNTIRTITPELQGALTAAYREAAS